MSSDTITGKLTEERKNELLEKLLIRQHIRPEGDEAAFEQPHKKALQDEKAY